MVRFENGCFASISEGQDRLGAVVASLYKRPVATTTQVIPDRSGSPFMRLAAERLAARLDGVALLSVNVGEVPPGAARKIMAELDGMAS